MRNLYLTWQVVDRSMLGTAPSFPTKARLFEAALPQHDGDPLAGGDVLAVRWDDNVAVRTGSGGDVAGALPADEFHVRVFVFAGNDCGEEPGEARFDPDLRFQTGMQESARVRAHTSRGFEQVAGERLNRDHGGDW